MKKSRRMVTRLLSWLLVVTLVCTGVPISAGAAKKPKLNKTSVKLKVGKTVKLKIKNNKKKVKWSSANKKIATVNQKGLVKAKKKGKTRIIAKIKKKKYICKVTVQAKNTDDSEDSAEEGNNDGGSGNTEQVTMTPSGGTAKPSTSPGKTPSVQKTAKPGETSGPQITPEPGMSAAPGETEKPIETQDPGESLAPGETEKPIETQDPGETLAPGETEKPSATQKPGGTLKPGETEKPSATQKPGSTLKPGETEKPSATQKPGSTLKPGETEKPSVTQKPGSTLKPGETPEPQETQAPQKTADPGVTTQPVKTAEPTNPTKAPTPTPTPTATPTKTPTPVPENPGQNVQLPEGATVFTIGDSNNKKLAIGMSRADVLTVLGSSSEQEIRTNGKSPQGFDTIAYHKKDYSEYLLIYLDGSANNSKVVGICGISKNMSFGGAIAGQDGNNLSGEWTTNNMSGYKVGSKYAAKQKNVLTTERVYAIFDALGDNTIYCIQVFDPTNAKIKINGATDNNMIFCPSNLSYDETVTSSIATEIGHMLNAFRVYKGKNKFDSYPGLTKCAQDYCNSATSEELTFRSDSEETDEDENPLPGTLLRALFDNNVDPDNWGEACYTDAADAISFANSLIEQDGFYSVLTNSKINDFGETPTWSYAGVGMAYNGSHAYVTVDYVDKL